MTRVMLLRWSAAACLGLTLAALAAPGVTGAKPDPPKLPAELQVGEAKFKTHCLGCHGEQGIGTIQGPPLVHKIYEPNHHGDAAFQRAAASGVRAHHWQFGNMPKIEGVTPQDVDHITKYVRWLQQEAGIH